MFYCDENTKKRLDTFEDLDFNVFNKQDWKALDRSHTNDVRVIWPDGHETVGRVQHEKDLAGMFVAMPDCRISSHTVGFGAGEWTCAIGVLEGTFTQPMPVGDGKTIAPTGNTLKLNMCTVSHWVGDTFDKEYLFWDQASFMKQLGIGQD